jgi:hypothetical protein
MKPIFGKHSPEQNYRYDARKWFRIYIQSSILNS